MGGSSSANERLNPVRPSAGSPSTGQTSKTRRLAGTLAALGIVMGVGWVDLLTGTELRVYPLYFFAIVLASWAGGRTGALLVATASAAAWCWFNYAAGMEFSHPAIWPINVTLQFATFLTVGLLIARLRGVLVSERRMARLDPLTGLPNARFFGEQARPAIERCRERGDCLTVGYLDLDHFKFVNDTHGHEAGDRTLQLVAEVLRQCTRGADVVARLGGDEFAFVLPDTDRAGAGVLLERVRERIRDAMLERDLPVRATVGAVVCQRGAACDLEALLRRADALMYEAKRLGKDRLQLEQADDEAAE